MANVVLIPHTFAAVVDSNYITPSINNSTPVPVRVDVHSGGVGNGYTIPVSAPFTHFNNYASNGGESILGDSQNSYILPHMVLLNHFVDILDLIDYFADYDCGVISLTTTTESYLIINFPSKIEMDRFSSKIASKSELRSSPSSLNATATNAVKSFVEETGLRSRFSHGRLHCRPTTPEHLALFELKVQ